MKDLKKKLKLLRVDTNTAPLNEKFFSKNPFIQFEKWMGEAINSGVSEPNAMTLATVDADGWPDARIVLLRDFNSSGFSFFTNYDSIKGREIRRNKKVCMNFFWHSSVRQIRIKGIAKKVSSKASDEYFNSRPRESQLGAWASFQSEKLNSKMELMDRYKNFEKKFYNKKVVRPPHWGGFHVSPVYIEFWQGQESRLHDRIFYEKSKNGKWLMGRLNP